MNHGIAFTTESAKAANAKRIALGGPLGRRPSPKAPLTIHANELKDCAVRSQLRRIRGQINKVQHRLNQDPPVKEYCPLLREFIALLAAERTILGISDPVASRSTGKGRPTLPPAPSIPERPEQAEQAESLESGV